MQEPNSGNYVNGFQMRDLLDVILASEVAPWHGKRARKKLPALIAEERHPKKASRISLYLFAVWRRGLLWKSTCDRQIACWKEVS